MSPLNGNYSGSSGHMCTYETCVLRTNLTVENVRRRFWVVADIRLVLSALSLNGLIIPLVCGGNEAAHLVQQKLDLLQTKLQLALEREREATQVAAEATQMVEIAQDKIAKTIERGRKF